VTVCHWEFVGLCGGERVKRMMNYDAITRLDMICGKNNVKAGPKRPKNYKAVQKYVFCFGKNQCVRDC
jgi:hypothetical protein